MTTPPVALTIAGSDSGGGAGIQADLTTFAAFDVHGASVVTALTAQNTVGVREVHVPPVGFLESQMEAVLADLPIAAVKTGMLATREVVEAVAAWASRGALPHLVVDPVLVASSGDRLLDVNAETAYLEALFPHSLVVTPNAREAAVLLGRPVDSTEALADAAADLANSGPRWVVVKGGHLEGPQAVDVLFDRDSGEVELLRAPRVETHNNHGTGCTFAAAMTSMLARGADPATAARVAKSHVHAALTASAGWELGGGHGPVSHLARDARAPKPRDT